MVNEQSGSNGKLSSNNARIKHCLPLGVARDDVPTNVTTFSYVAQHLGVVKKTLIERHVSQKNAQPSRVSIRAKRFYAKNKMQINKTRREKYRCRRNAETASEREERRARERENRLRRAEAREKERSKTNILPPGSPPRSIIPSLEPGSREESQGHYVVRSSSELFVVTTHSHFFKPGNREESSRAPLFKILDRNRDGSGGILVPVVVSQQSS